MAKVNTQLYGELAILPYQAEAPIKETLEFLTDVMQAYDATEKRLQLRSKPRQSFSYSVPIQAWRSAAAFNTQYGAIRKDWAVPLWAEAQYVGNVAQDADEVFCNTSLYDLRDSSLAMLYSVCGNFQVIEIDQVFSNRITLLSQADEISGAWLMPVRKGWINGNVDMPTSGHNSKQSVTFVIDDNPTIAPAIPAQYLGDDIYYDVPLLSNGAVSTSLSQQQDVTDLSLGPVARRTNWNRPQYGKPWRSLLETPQKVRSYREFLYRRAGKFRSFWFPTFENNMRLASTGNISTTITISSDSFLDYASLRNHIAIEANGVWYPRAISNPIQLDPERIQFTLSSALNIRAETIGRISYLGLHRFDADRIELNWRGGGIVETNVQILELAP
ncbi:tail assembly structural protein [Pseudomonas phage vB_PaeS_SCUT-S3]|uniref:Tail assembly structural protein n=1 Tax=Pseudomonas phage vB_PaeS_SCUT-S3 TaxID=2382122 RepID=A0A3Q8KTT8_9CAUD|nr:tail assembly structural protein [Pseudomonas phage vB_PaeS_SCUT-S3]AZF90027.1 tail assembly structural protein [Pseudomonas phage vB_PaeS_SCUT-S3]